MKLLKIRFTRAWWSKFPGTLKNGSSDAIKQHLDRWISIKLERNISAGREDHFGRLLLYDAKNKVHEKMVE